LDARALQGFAALLCAISIDDDFIRMPFVTDKKLELMDMNISPVERWFAAADRRWVVGERIGVRTLWNKYLKWVQAEDPFCLLKTEKAFGTAMRGLEAKGYVKKNKPSNYAYTKLKYYEPDSESFIETFPRPMYSVNDESFFYADAD
jgi:hypothetical protein